MNASGRLVDPEAIGNVIAMLCLPLSPRHQRRRDHHRRGHQRVSFDPATSSRRISCGTSQDGVATITLNRPERKNPLTFDSYDELRDTFRALDRSGQVKAVVITRRGRQFLLGRRRPRNHRPADQDGPGRPAEASRA